MDNNYDIFISYRREGGAQYARILQLKLIERGYKVFLDYDEINEGVFDDEVRNAIKSAPIFMLVLSPRIMERCVYESDWVRQEILLAINENKHFIPIDPDNKFDGNFPKGIPEKIKSFVSSHQQSGINFGQYLDVCIDNMINNRIKAYVIPSQKENKQRPIFISYKRIDKKMVFSLKDIIEVKTGQKCWIDLDGIESDKQFANVIINAINNAKIVLFMYSKAHSLIDNYESDWTIRELNFAQEKGKRIVFVNIDKSPLTDWFRLMFGTKQQVDATSNSAINKLIEDLISWAEEKTKENVMSIDNKDENVSLLSKFIKRIKRNKITFLIFAASLLLCLLYGVLSLSDSPVFHRLNTWNTRLSKGRFPEFQSADLSTGRLYGMHEAVDLGLSVKWATCNIGAKTPYERGDFYAWGEIKSKERIDRDNYKFGYCSYEKKELSKYCTDSIYGCVDNLTVLCDSDDVAHITWGNGWRIPTYDEISELKENCFFEKRSVYGVDGIIVTGPNKKKIFIPFAGDVTGYTNLPDGEGTYAVLWSSSLCEENNYAYELAFSIADDIWYRGERFTGHNIRAVHE